MASLNNAIMLMKIEFSLSDFSCFTKFDFYENIFYRKIIN